MLLRCEVVVANRLAASVAARKCYATLSLGRKKDKCGKELVYFIVHTTKNKIGTKYQIKENILHVHSRFADEGKCTLSMKDPPHDLILSKAPKSCLKKFLHVLKLAFNGQDTSDVVDLNSVLEPKYCDLEKPKTFMKILSKGNYPMCNSFPRSLETLIINQCSLKKFDLRILGLINLKVLDLRYNNLSSLCTNLDSLTHLWSITLANNVFQEIPACLMTEETSKHIKLLDLSNNQITFISSKLAQMGELVTLKLNRNNIEFLPSKIGHLQRLKELQLYSNKISLLPWTFRTLQLDTLDLSGNLFGEIDKHQLSHNIQDDIPTLFELTARFTVKHRIKLHQDYVPRFILQQIESVKFCPCGTPCFSHCIPFVKPFDLGQVSSSVSYDQVIAGRTMAKMVGYFCSKYCHKRWLDNPNTLFTLKKRKK